MQILGVILVLINVATIVAPIAGVVVVYQSDLMEMVIPPEVEQIVSETISTFTLTDSSSPSSNQFELPKYVSSTYDLATRTATIVFTFKNPLNFDISLSEASGDVMCHEHGVMLGHGGISEPVQLNAGESTTISVIFNWTQEGEEHLENDHEGQTSINVDLVNLILDISGISIETPESYNLDIQIPQ